MRFSVLRKPTWYWNPSGAPRKLSPDGIYMFKPPLLCREGKAPKRSDEILDVSWFSQVRYRCQLLVKVLKEMFPLAPMGRGYCGPGHLWDSESRCQLDLNLFLELLLSILWKLRYIVRCKCPSIEWVSMTEIAYYDGTSRCRLYLIQATYTSPDSRWHFRLQKHWWPWRWNSLASI